MSESSPGTLYLVATPIGNLSDISSRAIQTLTSVDFIAAEDTRVTRKLLEHLSIKKPTVSYYRHNSRKSGDKIVLRIQSGESCALVTDAGTPGISDPGEDLVRLCADVDVPMIVIPGPCAAVSALSLSGLDAGRFTFEGFLSATGKSRLEHLNELLTERRTMVFYEAPHKLIRTLTDMLEVFGDRRISISRELTKIYEETLRFTIAEALTHFSKEQPRGEFVLIVEGDKSILDPSVCVDDAVVAAVAYINGGLSVKDAVKQASNETGVPKNILYNSVIAVSDKKEHE